MRTAYPTIFTKIDEGYLIEVPDLKILTEGIDIVDSIEMARNEISSTIIALEDEKRIVPPPSAIEHIDVAMGTFSDEGKSFVSVVDVDTADFRRKVSTKPVRRNVSLPSWLNYEATKAGINVSRFLQDALIEKLNMKR